MDISNLHEASIVCQYNSYAKYHDIFIADNYAYVKSSDGLLILNVSDPTHPFLTGYCNTGTNTQAITLSGNYAYACSYCSLYVFDVSSPSLPTLVKKYGFSYTSYTTIGTQTYYEISSVIVGQHLYTSRHCLVPSLVVLDISDPNNLKEVAFVEWMYPKFSIKDNYLISAHMEILDISTFVLSH